MQTDQRLAIHEKLVGAMADALGVDLDERQMRGQMDPAEMQTLVERCTGCRKAEACPGWVAANRGRAQAAPDYCENGSFFNLDLA